MKYLMLLSLLFLAGCGNGNAESNGVRIGQFYTVAKGFYAGCTGVATDYGDYNSIPDSLTLREVTCKNVTATYIIVDPKDLK